MNNDELQKAVDAMRRAHIRNQWRKLFDIEALLPELLLLSVKTLTVVGTLAVLGVV